MSIKRRGLFSSLLKEKDHGVERGGHWKGVLNKFFSIEKITKHYFLLYFQHSIQNNIREQLTFQQLNIF